MKKTLGTIFSNDPTVQITFPDKSERLFTRFHDHQLEGICYVNGVPHWYDTIDDHVGAYYWDDDMHNTGKVEGLSGENLSDFSQEFSRVSMKRIFYIEHIEKVIEMLKAESRGDMVHVIISMAKKSKPSCVGVFYEKLN